MLKDKVVLVTGSSRGIGASTIREFANKGCNVVINYNKDKIRAEDLQKEIINDFGVKCLCIQADVSNEKDCIKMMNQIIKEFGKLDILVNNAGIVVDKPLMERTVEEFKKTIDTNLIGTFVLSKLASKYMIENKYGKIINISSTNAINAFSPEAVDYDASKAGIITLTKNFAIELSPYINVNAISPGWVDTEMNSELPTEFIEEEANKIWLKRFARPEEIAKCIVFLASEDASFIQGEVLKVDGGY